MESTRIAASRPPRTVIGSSSTPSRFYVSKDARAGGERSVDKKSLFFSKSRAASRSTVTISEPRSTSSSAVSPTQSNDLCWAKRTFLDAFKDYEATSELDQIRKQYYSRLDLDQHVYLDYTGMCLSSRFR